MVKITCTSCEKVLSIDEAKLPMREVKFPCPQCKADQLFDRRKLTPSTESSPVAAEAAPVAVASARPSVAPAAAGQRSGAGLGMPKALLVGQDSPAIREAAESIGAYVQHFEDAETARDYFYREHPPVVFLHPKQISGPPITEMAALTSVSPIDRRKGFFVLVADKLRTLDGNAAFLYQVNLVVATKDLGSFSTVYNDASTYHERLYDALNSLSGKH